MRGRGPGGISANLNDFFPAEHCDLNLTSSRTLRKQRRELGSFLDEGAWQ